MAKTNFNSLFGSDSVNWDHLRKSPIQEQHIERAAELRLKYGDDYRAILSLYERYLAQHDDISQTMARIIKDEVQEMITINAFSQQHFFRCGCDLVSRDEKEAKLREIVSSLTIGQSWKGDIKWPNLVVSMFWIPALSTLIELHQRLVSAAVGLNTDKNCPGIIGIPSPKGFFFAGASHVPEVAAQSAALSDGGYILIYASPDRQDVIYQHGSLQYKATLPLVILYLEFIIKQSIKHPRIDIKNIEPIAAGIKNAGFANWIESSGLLGEAVQTGSYLANTAGRALDFFADTLESFWKHVSSFVLGDKAQYDAINDASGAGTNTARLTNYLVEGASFDSVSFLGIGYDVEGTGGTLQKLNYFVPWEVGKDYSGLLDKALSGVNKLYSTFTGRGTFVGDYKGFGRCDYRTDAKHLTSGGRIIQPTSNEFLSMLDRYATTLNTAYKGIISPTGEMQPMQKGIVQYIPKFTGASDKASNWTVMNYDFYIWAIQNEVVGMLNNCRAEINGDFYKEA